MRITGTLHSIGIVHECGDETVTGILITADDATLRAASNLLYCTVDIYPHPVNELIAAECTPENYAHALARASATADHLAREVRSSQALIAKQAEQERLLSIYRTKYHEAERARMKAMVDLIGYKEAVGLLAQCTPPGMFVRETAEGWRLMTDSASTLHDSETAALKEAWTIYRAAQDDDESTLGTIQTPTPTFDDEGNET